MIIVPEISVVMSVYNGQPFLSEAVDSILNQSFHNYEFIIINDGSTDGSTKILQQYAAIDTRIVLIEQENKGLITALNTGLEKAKAPLIARMDADDIALPHRLEVQRNYMHSYKNIDLLGSAVTVIDEQGQPSKTITYPRTGPALDQYIYERGSPVAHPAVMMRREAVIDLGGYRDAYKHAEDYDLWLRMHKHGVIDNLNEVLLMYRHHRNKISVKHAYDQALISVVARHASKVDPDPTRELTVLSEDTLDLFSVNQAILKWEMLDILSTSLLLSPDPKAIEEILQQCPQTLPLQAKIFAARMHIKLAFAAFKANNFAKSMIFILKAMYIHPRHTMSMVLYKLMN